MSSEFGSRGEINSDFIESEQNELSLNHNDMKINDSMINKGFQGGSISERPVVQQGKETYSQVLLFGGSGFKGPGER